jgi:hypothetical protein
MARELVFEGDDFTEKKTKKTIQKQRRLSFELLRVDHHA